MTEVSEVARLVETERYPDHVIAALTLEPARATIRWSIIALDHTGDGVVYVRAARDGHGGEALLSQFYATRSYWNAIGLRPRALVVALGSGVARSRPDLQRLIALADEQWCAWVLARDCERFTRDPILLARLERQIEEGGAVVRTLMPRDPSWFAPSWHSQSRTR